MEILLCGKPGFCAGRFSEARFWCPCMGWDPGAGPSADTGIWCAHVCQHAVSVGRTWRNQSGHGAGKIQSHRMLCQRHSPAGLPSGEEGRPLSGRCGERSSRLVQWPLHRLLHGQLHAAFLWTDFLSYGRDKPHCGHGHQMDGSQLVRRPGLLPLLGTVPAGIAFRDSGRTCLWPESGSCADGWFQDRKSPCGAVRLRRRKSSSRDRALFPGRGEGEGQKYKSSGIGGSLFQREQQSFGSDGTAGSVGRSGASGSSAVECGMSESLCPEGDAERGDRDLSVRIPQDWNQGRDSSAQRKTDRFQGSRPSWIQRAGRQSRHGRRDAHRHPDHETEQHQRDPDVPLSEFLLSVSAVRPVRHLSDRGKQYGNARHVGGNGTGDSERRKISASGR